jgi:virulence factor Mce-like protein
VTIAAQVAAAVIAAGGLFVASGARLPFGEDHVIVEATVPDAAGLDTADHPTVTVGGVKAGAVDAVRFAPGDGTARVRLSLEASVANRLFADATVSIRPRSALQDLVVDVDPGDPAAGPLRSRMIRAGAVAPVGYDRVLGVLDADTRAYAQVLLGTLRRVVAGREGPLRDALQRLPSTTDGMTRVARELATRRRDLARVVDQLDTILRATGRRGAQLTRVVRQARRTLAVTDARRDALSAAIAELPATLRRAEATFAGVARLAEPLRPALRALRPAARALPSGLRSVRALLPQLGGTLTDLDTLSAGATRPLRSLERVAHELGPASRELMAVVPLVDRVVRVVSSNQPVVRRMLEFWPGTLSSANSLAVVTRAIFFRTLPIKPGAVGLSGDVRAEWSLLRKATALLRRERPELFGDRDTRASLPLTAARALIAGRCGVGVDIACGLLRQLYTDPPRLLAR